MADGEQTPLCLPGASVPSLWGGPREGRNAPCVRNPPHTQHNSVRHGCESLESGPCVRVTYKRAGRSVPNPNPGWFWGVSPFFWVSRGSKVNFQPDLDPI